MSRINLSYVIDNHERRLADVLSALPHGDTVHALDIATAYFEVGAFQLLQTRLPQPAAARGGRRQGGLGSAVALQVNRQHILVYGALVTPIQETDSLINQIPYRLYGLTAVLFSAETATGGDPYE